MNNLDKIITLVCAVLIAFLETLALIKGINGTVLSIAIGALAGLGGYTIRGLLK